MWWFWKSLCNICIDLGLAEYNVLQRPGCIFCCPSRATEAAANSSAKEWMTEMLKYIDTQFTMQEIILQHRNTEFDQNLDDKLK